MHVFKYCKRDNWLNYISIICSGASYCIRSTVFNGLTRAPFEYTFLFFLVNAVFYNFALLFKYTPVHAFSFRFVFFSGFAKNISENEQEEHENFAKGI